MHRHEICTQRNPVSRFWWLRLMAGEQCPARYVEAHAVKGADFMIARVAPVSEDTRITEVVDLLEAQNLRRVQVVPGQARWTAASAAQIERFCRSKTVGACEGRVGGRSAGWCSARLLRLLPGLKAPGHRQRLAVAHRT